MFEQYSWYNKLPSESLPVCEENLYSFFRTMYERQMIWKRRFLDHKERPWTEDAILATSKFTNVYRDLDRNSQWQIKHIIMDDELSLTNLVWKMMVFRFFNNPATFEFNAKEHPNSADLFNPAASISATDWRNGIPNYEEYDEDEFREFIDGVRRSGINPFTTAYLINSMAAPDMNRDDCYTRVVIPTLHRQLPKLMKTVMKAETPEDIIDFLKTLPGVADFIAHEFYQDFTYINKYTTRHFMRFTQDDYTNVGPGASVGIRLIFPNLKARNQKSGIYRLRDMAAEKLNEIGQTLGTPMPFLYWDKDSGTYYTTEECNITLHQIEMWLCEYQKYWKMVIGEGKQRSKFVPRTKELITKG